MLLEMLCRTRQEPGYSEGRYMERGQFYFGYEEIGEAAYLSFQEARTIIDWFKKVRILTTKPTSPGQIGTLCNFNTYSPPKEESNNLSNSELTTNQQETNNKLQVTREYPSPRGGGT